MVILGVWDGVDAGAALVLDGELVAVEHEERYAREPGARLFPWTAIDMVLEAAGLRNADVDLIGVAGRFSPLLAARRHPALRKVLKRSPFSWTLDIEVLVQSTLRLSGIGAADADRASEHFEAVFAKRGFRAQRVLMVDAHAALAAAAYRQQADDDVLAFTLHPLGDGVSCGVHLCRAGQVHRTWAQQGFSALHLHIERCMAAIGGFRRGEDRAFFALAGRGEPDPDWMLTLGRVMRTDGPRLLGRPFPFPTHHGVPLYSALAKADPATAAASVLQNVIEVVTDLLRWHVRENGVSDVVLGGQTFDNPRLVAAIAAMPEVRSVSVGPTPGSGSLAAGAALHIGGIAPAPLPRGLGCEWSEVQLQRALASAGVRASQPPDEAEALAEVLAQDLPVGRFFGRGGLARDGLGTRSVLVRADRPEVLARVREALRRPELEEPGLLWLPAEGETLPHLAKIGTSARFGSVALPVPDALRAPFAAALSPDGRVNLEIVDPSRDPYLTRILQGLRRRTGGSALAVLPLGLGREPAVAVPGDALRLWAHGGLAAMQLGPFVVRR